MKKPQWLMPRRLFDSMHINEKTIKILKQGGAGVLPTDTLYGLVGSALNKKAVERIYKLKKRNPNKPMIVLIEDLKDLDLFGVAISARTKKLLGQFWPGVVSVILQCHTDKDLSYLHRGAKTIAFRLPKPMWLRDFLRKTGPLAAPSANPENKEPAETIKQAREYFDKRVDFYVEGGRLTGLPSTLIEIKKDSIIIKRQGAAAICI